MSEKVIEMLDWVKTFIKSTPSQRRQFRDVLIKGLREFKINNENAGEVLVKALNDKSQLEFVGFGVNMSYIFENHAPPYNEAVMVHPFGGPTLIYKYKNFPAYLVTSPSLRHNKSHIAEMKENNYQVPVEGWTD